MARLDLTALAESERLTVISDKERGARARAQFGLDELDNQADQIVVVVPEHVRAITPSFVLGMFGPSVRRCGTVDQFFDRYRFEAPTHILAQIRRGAQYSLMKGSALEAA